MLKGRPVRLRRSCRWSVSTVVWATFPFKRPNNLSKTNTSPGYDWNTHHQITRFFASHASMQKPQGNMSRMFVKAIGLSNLGGRCIRTCGGSLLLNLKAENFTTSRSSTTRQDLLKIG